MLRPCKVLPFLCPLDATQLNLHAYAYHIAYLLIATPSVVGPIREDVVAELLFGTLLVGSAGDLGFRTRPLILKMKDGWR
jgi:hypothetical protein